MLNFIKYLPLEWRKRQIACTPKGPSFASAPRVKIPIAGSILGIRAPRHSPHWRGVEQYRLLPGADALDQGLGRYAADVVANDHWGFRTALLRHWTFWGPWLTGAKGQLVLSVTVKGRREGFEFPNISYFNPHAFEMVLVHYLNDFYGFSRWDDGKPRRYGPVDWQVHHQLPVFSASCKVYKVEPDGRTHFKPDHLFYFPITESHFVEIRFQQDTYSHDERGNPDFDVTPLQALQDAVLNSITLELSPEAQAAWNKAQAECGGHTLTESFPPLRWPTTGNEASDSQVQPGLEKTAGRK